MALARCTVGKFLGEGCHCFPPPLDIPTTSARCLHVQRRKRPPAAEGETLCWREMFRQISPRIRLPRNSRDLLHAANLRHGTDGFTSPPKEGIPRIFSLDMIQYKKFRFPELQGKLPCPQKLSRNFSHQLNTSNPKLPFHFTNTYFCIIFKSVSGSSTFSAYCLSRLKISL